MGGGFNPSRGQGIVQVRPLRDYMRLSLERVLPEPRLDIRPDRLSRFRAAPISDDRTKNAGNPVPQSVVGSSERGRCGGRGIIGSRRWPRLKVFVPGKRLRDQPGADGFAVRPNQHAAVCLEGKEKLSNTPQRGHVNTAADDHENGKEQYAF